MGMLSFFWLFLGTVYFFKISSWNWLDSLYLLVIFANLLVFTKGSFLPYISIKNGVLIMGTLRSKKIHLKEIISIKKFAGDYTVKTKESSLEINTQLIDTKSLNTLLSELQKLPVTWQ